jgi:hypothetical protein
MVFAGQSILGTVKNREDIICQLHPVYDKFGQVR